MKQKYLLQLIGKGLFRLSLYTGATIFAFFTVFGSSDLIKQTLVSSKAYDNFVAAILHDSAAAQVNGSVPLTDPDVVKAIEASFPPQYLRYYTEVAINGTYRWLNGEVSKPDFVIDVGPNIDAMAERLSDIAVNRLSFKPVCVKEPTEVNPFTDSCRPEFFDYKQAKATLITEIKSNNGIFKKTKFTADDLPKNGDGQTIVQQYSYAPTLFRIGQYAHWLFLGVAAQGMLLVVYAARKKREAFKYLGYDSLNSGLFLAMTPLFYIYVLPRFFSGFSGQASGEVGRLVQAATASVSTNFNNLLILIGVMIALFGLSILALERGTRPTSKYRKLNSKIGMATSEEPRKRKRDRQPFVAANIPIQTSEGERNTGKFQKDKKYRRVPRREL